MKKLNITKEAFEKSRYFTKKYGTLEYVSESGKVFKTSKGNLIEFNESDLEYRDWDLETPGGYPQDLNAALRILKRNNSSPSMDDVMKQIKDWSEYMDVQFDIVEQDEKEATIAVKHIFGDGDVEYILIDIEFAGRYPFNFFVERVTRHKYESAMKKSTKMSKGRLDEASSQNGLTTVTVGFTTLTTSGMKPFQKAMTLDEFETWMKNIGEEEQLLNIYHELSSKDETGFELSHPIFVSVKLT